MMRALSRSKTFGLIFIMTSILILESTLYYDVFGQENKNKYDIVLLSQNYNINALADEIVGTILNNGTSTAKYVEVSAIFYDDDGKVIGHESDGTSPSSISSGDISDFTLQITDEAIKSNATSYDFTLKWQDEHSFGYFMKVTGGEIGDDGDGDDGDGDDN
ncbi:MAG TPA: FxLYD domain-containing protein [Candidatus Nitrosocosmicus sp.]|nr:FxLYD domain-containing protein [Candidatus Nitrosocosmicus sp.]